MASFSSSLRLIMTIKNSSFSLGAILIAHGIDKKVLHAMGLNSSMNVIEKSGKKREKERGEILSHICLKLLWIFGVVK